MLLGKYLIVVSAKMVQMSGTVRDGKRIIKLVIYNLLFLCCLIAFAFQSLPILLVFSF
jgi:hypothetical protein